MTYRLELSISFFATGDDSRKCDAIATFLDEAEVAKAVRYGEAPPPIVTYSPTRTFDAPDDATAMASAQSLIAALKAWLTSNAVTGTLFNVSAADSPGYEVGGPEAPNTGMKPPGAMQ